LRIETAARLDSKKALRCKLLQVFGSFADSSGGNHYYSGGGNRYWQGGYWHGQYYNQGYYNQGYDPFFGLIPIPIPVPGY
jgi:hypothetical protein